MSSRKVLVQEFSAEGNQNTTETACSLSRLYVQYNYKTQRQSYVQCSKGAAGRDERHGERDRAERDRAAAAGRADERLQRDGGEQHPHEQVAADCRGWEVLENLENPYSLANIAFLGVAHKCVLESLGLFRTDSGPKSLILIQGSLFRLITVFSIGL